jgi:hypothetical protein
MTRKTNVGAAIVAMIAACFQSSAVTAIVTETLSVTVNPAGKLSVPASVTLNHAGTIFNPFTGALTLNYRARTVSGGIITLRMTSDFPSGGPSVAGGDLQYTCGGATLGATCSGSITASTSAATPVLTLPPASCTGPSCGNADPNSTSIGFTLNDSTVSKTGSYTATAQFTISST